MEKVYNINVGELIILPDTEYKTFLNLGNKVVINKTVKSIYNNATNFKSPIKLTEGNYNTNQLLQKNISKPDFKTLILGPMTKIKITYSNSKVDNIANLKSSMISSSNLVLNNHSEDSIYVSQANIEIKNLGNNILNIEVINLYNIDSNKELNDYSNFAINLQKSKKLAYFSPLPVPSINKNIPQNKQCMKLDKFLILLILTILIGYLIFNFSKK